jgi:hypothetical protein
MAEFRAAMPSGSYVAISSLRLPGPELPELRAVTLEGEKLMAGPLGGMRWREDSEIRSWFADWELVSPGLVPVGDWRPPVAGQAPYPEIQQSFSGGVARKR